MLFFFTSFLSVCSSLGEVAAIVDCTIARCALLFLSSGWTGFWPVVVILYLITFPPPILGFLAWLVVLLPLVGEYGIKIFVLPGEAFSSLLVL